MVLVFTLCVTNSTVIPCIRTFLTRSFIHPLLHLLDFWKKSLLQMIFYSRGFNLLCSAFLTHAIDASCSHVCTDEWHPAASTLCFLSPAHKKSTGDKSQLCSKQNSNESSPGDFLTIGGYFKCYMYWITALGWLKKEEGKKGRKKVNEQFWPLTVSDLLYSNSIVQTNSDLFSDLELAMLSAVKKRSNYALRVILH